MILNLGNIEMRDDPAKEGTLIENPEQLSLCSSLIQIDAEELKKAITHRSVTVVGETSYIPLREKDSLRIRDALAKHLYARLFDWLLGPINKALSLSESKLHIGILDIFGFEVFDENLFEQLCINYANEKLQQHFISYIFKQEQEEYRSEGISFEDIPFVDNQVCLDLIEGKRGIMPELDQQVVIPQGNDNSFVTGLHERFDRELRHESYKLDPRYSECFTIIHYAGNVSYSSIGMVEKDRDSLHALCVEAMEGSKNSLVERLFDNGEELSTKRKETLGTQFRKQLSALVAKLNTATPHFVRCIKPNTRKASDFFDEEMVLRQLSYAGLFEAMRVRRAGYGYRKQFKDFAQRYGLIAEVRQRRKLPKGDWKFMCQEVLNSLRGEFPPTDLQVGNTKVFYREQSKKVLELAREDAVIDSVITIQRYVRGFLARLRYKQLKALNSGANSAIQSRDLGQLRSVVGQARAFGSNIESVQRAKDLIFQLEEEIEIAALLAEALGREDVRLLRDGIARANRINLKGTSKIQEALSALSKAEEMLEKMVPTNDPRTQDPLMQADLERLADALRRGDQFAIEDLFVSADFAMLAPAPKIVDEAREELFVFWRNQIEVLLTSVRAWEFPDVEDDNGLDDFTQVGLPTINLSAASIAQNLVAESVEDLLDAILNKIIDAGYYESDEIHEELTVATDFLCEQEVNRTGRPFAEVQRERVLLADERRTNRLLNASAPIPIEVPRSAPRSIPGGPAKSNQDYIKQIEALLTTSRNFDFPDVDEFDSAGLQRVLSTAGFADSLINNLDTQRAGPVRLLSNQILNRTESLLDGLLNELIANGKINEPELSDEIDAVRQYLAEQESKRTGLSIDEARQNRARREAEQTLTTTTRSRAPRPPMAKPRVAAPPRPNNGGGFGANERTFLEEGRSSSPRPVSPRGPRPTGPRTVPRRPPRAASPNTTQAAFGVARPPPRPPSTMPRVRPGNAPPRLPTTPRASTSINASGGSTPRGAQQTRGPSVPPSPRQSRGSLPAQTRSPRRQETRFSFSQTSARGGQRTRGRVNSPVALDTRSREIFNRGPPPRRPSGRPPPQAQGPVSLTGSGALPNSPPRSRTPSTSLSRGPPPAARSPPPPRGPPPRGRGGRPQGRAGNRNASTLPRRPPPAASTRAPPRTTLPRSPPPRGSAPARQPSAALFGFPPPGAYGARPQPASRPPPAAGAPPPPAPPPGAPVPLAAPPGAAAPPPAAGGPPAPPPPIAPPPPPAALAPPVMRTGGGGPAAAAAALAQRAIRVQEVS